MADAATAAPVTPAAAPAPTGNAPPAAGEVKPTPKPTTPKPDAAAQEGPGKVKLRDPRTGQFVEVDEGEAWALYNRGKSTQKTLSAWEREKAAKEKEFREREAEMERLKDDDGALEAFLRKIGRDPSKLGEKFVLKDIEEQKLTPEQRELRAERAKREELERKEAERTQQEEQKNYEAATAQEADRLGGLFADALEEAGIPEKASRMFFPAMAGLYRGARAQAMHDAQEMSAQTGQAVDYRTLMPPPKFFADHLKDTMVTMLHQYTRGEPPEMAQLLREYAAKRPVEELEELIGEREYEGKKLKYPEIVNQRYVKALLERRKGTPGAAQPQATGVASAVGSYDLPSDVVRSMPGDLQNLYWRMQNAHPEEKSGIVRNFEATARKYGVQLPGR